MTDLRPIALGDRARTPGRKAAKPLLTWLAVDRLRLDDSYQRSLGAGNWRSIETIAADFDWARFTPILAAPLDGGLYAIIDGQHRTHAAALRGFDEVPAMVVPMTHAEQARAFAWVNGQVTAITIFHVFKAALVAGEPWALDARAAVEAAGCRLMTYPVSTYNRRPREIDAVGLVREHVRAGRGELVTAALRAISEAEIGDWPDVWGGGDPERLPRRARRDRTVAGGRPRRVPQGARHRRHLRSHRRHAAQPAGAGGPAALRRLPADAPGAAQSIHHAKRGWQAWLRRP